MVNLNELRADQLILDSVQSSDIVTLPGRLQKQRYSHYEISCQSAGTYDMGESKLTVKAQLLYILQ